MKGIKEQLVVFRSPAKRSTPLSSAVHVAVLYEFAMTFKLAVWLWLL
jgi:hypothetical protein